MQGFCEVTGEYCPALDLWGDLGEPALYVREGRPNSKKAIEALNVYRAKADKLLGMAQLKCTEESCGMVALGSAIALRLQALEETKNEVGAG